MTGEVSEREAEVLAAVGAGLSNAQIARRLHLSVRTVEGHVSSLLRKCNVSDRHALAALSGAGLPAGGVSGLPVARTTLVGRATERQAIRAALSGGRLVTLAGPGGVGKTRLAAAVAAEVAEDYPYGVGFVDLVPVRDGFVVQAVAATLGVTEGAQQPLDQAILRRLAPGRSLLVLDNCEHLLDAAAAFADCVLSACPEAVVLTTSRERLGLPGERVVPIGPLPLGSDAELLFQQRADPEFLPDSAAVADLCARLDGLPLAIELAAARSASLGVSGLLTGLGDSLRLLAGGRGPAVRHRSLRAVIDWSHDLLDDEERAVFRRLAVFAGSFDLPAAVSVTAAGEPAVVADLLGRLVDKSLVLRSAGRWSLLETVRVFAAEMLERSGEGAAVRQRHLDWAVESAAALEARLDGRWRDELDTVVGDLRAAVEAGAGPGAHRLARSLGRLTFARRFLAESLSHYRRAAQLAPSPEQAARDLIVAADCAQVLNRSADAFDLLLEAADQATDGRTEALALARAVELAGRYPVTFRTEISHDHLHNLLTRAAAREKKGPIAAQEVEGQVAGRVACARAWVGSVEMLTAEPELAEAAVLAARASGDPVLVSAALDALRTARVSAGRLREAHRLAAERLALLPELDRNDPYSTAEIIDVLPVACTAAVAAGDLPAAMDAVRLIEDDDLIGYQPYLTAAQTMPALVLTGELERAVEDASTMWDQWQRDGRPPAYWMQTAVHFVALAHGLFGDETEFDRWRARLIEVAGSPEPIRARLAPLACFVDTRVAVHTGDLTGADALVVRAFDDQPRARYLAYARAAAAELAVLAGLPDAAERVANARPAADQNDWAAACLTRATGRLHHDPALLTDAADQWHRLGARFEHECTMRLIKHA